jgi:hypothetical protein
MASEILHLLNIPHEMALQFLAVFSRFEYALKRAGYVRGDEKGVAADWDRFAQDLPPLGEAALRPILASAEYLQQHPPRKQILKAGRLHWEERGAGAGSVIGNVLLSVRTVRNNVFHGGKFREGPIAEPLRDERLIRECVAVLESLLALPLPNQVADYFRPE